MHMRCSNKLTNRLAARRSRPLLPPLGRGGRGGRVNLLCCVRGANQKSQRVGLKQKLEKRQRSSCKQHALYLRATPPNPPFLRGGVNGGCASRLNAAARAGLAPLE